MKGKVLHLGLHNSVGKQNATKQKVQRCTREPPMNSRGDPSAVKRPQGASQVEGLTEGEEHEKQATKVQTGAQRAMGWGLCDGEKTGGTRGLPELHTMEATRGK